MIKKEDLTEEQREEIKNTKPVKLTKEWMKKMCEEGWEVVK
jgi:hypothetical protein